MLKKDYNLFRFKAFIVQGLFYQILCLSTISDLLRSVRDFYCKSSEPFLLHLNCFKQSITSKQNWALNIKPLIHSHVTKTNPELIIPILPHAWRRTNYWQVRWGCGLFYSFYGIAQRKSFFGWKSSLTHSESFRFSSRKQKQDRVITNIYEHS